MKITVRQLRKLIREAAEESSARKKIIDALENNDFSELTQRMIQRGLASGQIEADLLYAGSKSALRIVDGGYNSGGKVRSAPRKKLIDALRSPITGDTGHVFPDIDERDVEQGLVDLNPEDLLMFHKAAAELAKKDRKPGSTTSEKQKRAVLQKIARGLRLNDLSDIDLPTMTDAFLYLGGWDQRSLNDAAQLAVASLNRGGYRGGPRAEEVDKTLRKRLVDAILGFAIEGSRNPGIGSMDKEQLILTLQDLEREDLVKLSRAIRNAQELDWQPIQQGGWGST